jgi:hypothetical protein
MIQRPDSQYPILLSSLGQGSVVDEPSAALIILDAPPTTANT